MHGRKSTVFGVSGPTFLGPFLGRGVAAPAGLRKPQGPYAGMPAQGRRAPCRRAPEEKKANHDVMLRFLIPLPVPWTRKNNHLNTKFQVFFKNFNFVRKYHVLHTKSAAFERFECSSFFYYRI